MLLFLLLILFSTSAVSAEENCTESEIKFRNCLRQSGGVTFFNRTHTEQMEVFKGCGAQESECYLQTEVVKLMKIITQAKEEEGDVYDTDSKIMTCRHKIADRFNKKCFRSRYDKYGFPLSFMEAHLNHMKCLIDYARKADFCSKNTLNRILKANAHGSIHECYAKLHSLGQYLEEYAN